MQDSPIVTVLLGLIADKFKLSSVQTLSISKLLDWGVKKFSEEESDMCWTWEWVDNLFSWWLLIPLLLIGLGVSLYWFYPWWKNRQYNILTVFDVSTIKDLNSYVRFFPEYVANTSTTVGALHESSIEQLQIPTDFAPMQVGELRCEIQIRYTRREKQVEVVNPTNGKAELQQKVEHIPCVTLRIPKSTITIANFLKEIQTKVNAYQDSQRRITVTCKGKQVKSVTATSVQWLTSTFYTKPRVEHNPVEIQNGYFYSNLDQLLNSINQALRDDQNWNAIFHGPPGTGKSYLATTLAKILERDIVSLDLRLFSRSQLLETLFGEDFQHKIFIFEEFDNTVRELLLRYEEERQKNQRIVDGQMIAPPANPDSLRLNDLLEIFQGPIPRPRMMIIATTNDLEYIRSSTAGLHSQSALIRPGRLTPYHIGYVDTPIFHRIVRTYFPNVPEIDLELPSTHQISTCAIIDYARTALGDYNTFRSLIQQDLNQSVSTN